MGSDDPPGYAIGTSGTGWGISRDGSIFVFVDPSELRVWSLEQGVVVDEQVIPHDSPLSGFTQVVFVDETLVLFTDDSGRLHHLELTEMSGG